MAERRETRLRDSESCAREWQAWGLNLGLALRESLSLTASLCCTSGLASEVSRHSHRTACSFPVSDKVGGEIKNPKKESK